MPIQVYPRHTCRLCNSDKLPIALPLKPTPLEDDFLPANKADPLRQRYPLEIALCEQCGHSQLSQVISAESIYDHYIYQTNTSPGLIKHFEETCDHIIQQVGLHSDDCVVDLGCNDGAVLEIYQKKGMRVVGVEPSPVAKVAQEKKIPTYQAYFNAETAQDIVKKHGSVALVTANNVFANVDDVDSFVAAIQTMLSPDGVFVIETGYWPLLVKNGVFDYIYHEHLSYFSVKPLQQFFKKHEMEIYNAECTEMKGGSVRLFIQKKNGGHKQHENVLALIHSEEKSGVFNTTLYQNFAKQLEKAKSECHALLDSLKATKNEIAGFGASPSVTTLLHLFDLGNHVSFLVDENKLKHNTVSPGHHLSVLPVSAIEENNIKYVLILPWRFSKTIINKNTAFLEKSGVFIEVYPTPKLVTCNQSVLI